MGHNRMLPPLDDSFAEETSRLRRVFSNRAPQARYSLFDAANLLACQERERRILSALVRHGLAPLTDIKILDIGCETGFWIREFVRWGAKPENIVGVELLPDRVKEAKSLCAAGAAILCANATDLNSPDEAFDIVIQSTVFTSVLDDKMRVRSAQEMVRVLRRNGRILWYDFTVNNPLNPNVRGINRKSIMRLFPNCRFEFQRLTLAPPIARPIALLSSLSYRVLSALRLFDTHCLAIIQKNAD
jgi:ubiquinone/menaquinone biosynthesis C-methylase UbiE